ncbi:MAG: 6-pyruvoyl trahydropterin synthase family protein [Candidatus Heimdallarchaeaceae archaeon]
MTYNLFLNRDYLTFSCAHFVIGENFYEPLHGHNYKILINVYGTQGKDNMVIDFHDIKKILKPFVDSLDHYVLVPTNNKFLNFLNQMLFYSLLKIQL